MREAVENTDRLIGLARAAGVRPIFIRAIYDEKWLSKPMLERHELVGLDTDHCQEGTWGADFYVVQPEPGRGGHRQAPLQRVRRHGAGHAAPQPRVWRTSSSWA